MIHVVLEFAHPTGYCFFMIRPLRPEFEDARGRSFAQGGGALRDVALPNHAAPTAYGDLDSFSNRTEAEESVQSKIRPQFPRKEEASWLARWMKGRR